MLFSIHIIISRMTKDIYEYLCTIFKMWKKNILISISFAPLIKVHAHTQILSFLFQAHHSALFIKNVCMLAETGKEESYYGAKMDFIIILIYTYIFLQEKPLVPPFVSRKHLTFRNMQKTFSRLNRVASRPPIVLYIPPCPNAFFLYFYY